MKILPQKFSDHHRGVTRGWARVRVPTLGNSTVGSAFFLPTLEKVPTHAEILVTRLPETS